MSHKHTDKTVKAPVEPRVSSQALLPDGMLYIRHNDEDYCLRVTRNGKLILTK